jgi:ATP-dependent DNA helicase RecG
MTSPLSSEARSALEQITNVLGLEARKGFQDRSATNGVAHFAGDRLRVLLRDAPEPQQRVLREIDNLLAGYEKLTPAQRERHVNEASSLVRDLLAGVHPPVLGAVPDRPERKQTKPRPKKQPEPRPTLTPDTPVGKLPSVGPGRVRQLEQLGVRTVQDLLFLFPRHHVDYGRRDRIVELRFGMLSTIRGVVASVTLIPTRTGKQMVDVVVQDETGSVHAVWFNPWIERQLNEGMEISLSGRVDQLRGTLCFKSPEWEPAESDPLHTGGLVPVYPLTKGLYQKTMRSVVRSALDLGLASLEEFLPATTLRRVDGLPTIQEAVEWAHFPSGDTSEEAWRRLAAARQRIAFNELLSLQIGLLRRRQQWRNDPGNSIPANAVDFEAMIGGLPFTLTSAQERTLQEILRDMAAPRPMSRLLQGDVGSGKTAVAAVAAFVAIRAGFQVALMAPTELLAEQHFRSLENLFSRLPEASRPTLDLLTGSTATSQRAEIAERLRNGTCDLLIGTHALIQGSVAFCKLGLAIIDEQHRFGVEQRGALRDKGVTPDVLVMTATPIPRSLALTVHGDLDVSTLDELPPGRHPIETRWVPAKEREDAYQFVREQVRAGHQIFVVFPLVEESEAVDARAAVEEHQRLSQDVFPALRVGLLHGRMRPAEKDAVMRQFRDREFDILVATSVVEVGIDIPNATVMMIEGADRFGLAQLHQFRGRVGRGTARSYCLLLADDISPEGRRRLEAMVDTQDGFRLAQIDLEMRGPGDFLGTRQSGLPEFHVADFADTRDLERARAEAERLLEEDPDLEKPEHQRLRQQVERFWSSATTEVS